MFRIQGSDGKARVGILETQRYKIETPLFLPVATKGVQKLVSQKELEEIGFDCIIVNSFLLYLRPGINVIKKCGGIHKFMNWKNGIFSDSGGFQVLKKSFLIGKNDKGVKFRSPFDNSKHFFTPEDSIRIQHEMGCDICMALDDVPSFGMSFEEVAECVRRTHLWAERCLKVKKDSQILFGIAQGNIFPQLRKASTKFISNLPFDGIAFGGICIGEPKEKTIEMIKLSSENSPDEKVRYLMGVGDPELILEAIENGIDIFDSAFPVTMASRGIIFTENGKIKIKTKRYEIDFSPLDENCSCYVCKNFSKAYIRHLIKLNEPVGLRYAAFHNLHFIKNLIERARKSILKGEFQEFKNSFLKNFRGDSLSHQKR